MLDIYTLIYSIETVGRYPFSVKITINCYMLFSNYFGRTIPTIVLIST